jgi:hypothetical protein
MVALLKKHLMNGGTENELIISVNFVKLQSYIYLIFFILEIYMKLPVQYQINSSRYRCNDDFVHCLPVKVLDLYSSMHICREKL